MAFTKSAAYRVYKGVSNDFDQAALLTSEPVQNLFASDPALDKKSLQAGICFGLCLIWIRNKALPVSERIRHAPARLKNFQALLNVQDVLTYQMDHELSSMRENFLAFLQKNKHVPKPVENVKPSYYFIDLWGVFETLPDHVPYMISYGWEDGTGHVIVYYATTKRVILFDPNCGELSCERHNIMDMWQAYCNDIKTIFGMPVWFSACSVGVKTPKETAKELVTEKTV
jgi:hypothetical protein